MLCKQDAMFPVHQRVALKLVTRQLVRIFSLVKLVLGFDVKMLLMRLCLWCMIGQPSGQCDQEIRW